MSIKSLILAASLGITSLAGVGAASAQPYGGYRGETPREARLDRGIARAEHREGRFERRTGRVDYARERRIHRMERRDGRLHAEGRGWRR